MPPTRLPSTPVRQSSSSRHHPYQNSQSSQMTCPSGVCRRDTDYMFDFSHRKGLTYHQVDHDFVKWCIDNKIYLKRVKLKDALEAHGFLLDATSPEPKKETSSETQPTSSFATSNQATTDGYSADEFSDGADDGLIAALELFEQDEAVKKEAASQTSLNSPAIRQPAETFQPPAIKQEIRGEAEPVTPMRSSSQRSLPNHAELISELAKTHKPSDYILQWGLHKGRRVGDVPHSYLQWLIDKTEQTTQNPLLAAALQHLGVTKTRNSLLTRALTNINESASPPTRKTSRRAWKPPSLVYAPRKFRDEWRNRPRWVAKRDAMLVFRLTAEEIDTIMPRAGRDEYKSSYLYHLWAFVKHHESITTADEMMMLYESKRYEDAIKSRSNM